MFFFFFFQQKTAYELRISDWSSDVCSSDLSVAPIEQGTRIMGQLDNRPDGVDVYPGDQHDFDSYPQGNQALSRMQSPVYVHADNPHERLYIAAMDGTGNSMSKDAPENWSRSEEHTSELPSQMRITYAVFCLKHTK